MLYLQKLSMPFFERVIPDWLLPNKSQVIPEVPADIAASTVPWAHPGAQRRELGTQDESSQNSSGDQPFTPAAIAREREAVPSHPVESPFNELIARDEQLRLRSRLMQTTSEAEFTTVLHEIPQVPAVEQFLLLYYRHLITPPSEPTIDEFSSFEQFQTTISHLELETPLKAYLLLQYQYFMGRTPTFNTDTNQIQSRQTYDLVTLLSGVEAAAHNTVIARVERSQTTVEQPAENVPRTTRERFSQKVRTLMRSSHIS